MTRAFASETCFVLAVPLMVLAWATALSVGPVLVFPAWGLAAAGALLLPTPRRLLVGVGIATLPMFFVGMVPLLVAFIWWRYDRSRAPGTPEVSS